MTRGREVDRDELETLVREYRHVRAAHGGARAGGRLRRRLGRRLAAVERRFERLLAASAASPELRQAWLAHLRDQAPEPDEPRPGVPPLAFKGRAENGSVVEVRQHRDGRYGVVVDGGEVELLAAADVVADTGPGVVFSLGGLAFHEVHDASDEAVAALARFAASPERGLAAEHVHELLADGLVDRDHGLTPRGRRALLRRAETAAPDAGPAVRVSTRGGVGRAERRRLEDRLRRVLRRAPMRVLSVHATLAVERNPSLARPVDATASVEVRGPDLQVRASAASPGQAVDLLADRLARRLRELARRRRAERRRTGGPEAA